MPDENGTTPREAEAVAPETVEVETPEAEAPPASAETAEQQKERERDQELRLAKKRNADLAYHRREAERRAEQLERQVEALAQRIPQQQERQEETAHPGLPPDRYSYDDDAAYQKAAQDYVKQSEAFTRHAMRQELVQISEQMSARERQEAERGRMQAVAEKMDEINTTGPARFPDFREVAFIPQGVADIVAEFVSDPAAIAYHWGKNEADRDNITRLAAIDPRRATAEIMRLDARLAAQKKVTSAPPPPSGVRGNAPPGGEPDASKDLEAWIKWERERVKKSGRRY